MIEFNFTSEQKRGLIFVFAAMIGLGGFYFLNSRPTIEQDHRLPIERKAEA